jgi:hypothetical protein
MPSREVTEEIARRFAEASKSCSSSLRVVMTNQSLGEVTVYGRLVGTFMGQCLTNVLAPIWSSNPSLEPPEMKIPYVEPIASLAPESRAALESFLTLAHAAVQYASENIPDADQAELFGFGGIAEVSEAAQAIAEFLAHPRHRDEGPAT